MQPHVPLACYRGRSMPGINAQIAFFAALGVLAALPGPARAVAPRGNPFANMQLNGGAALTSKGHLLLVDGLAFASSAYVTTPVTFTATSSFISTFKVTMHRDHYHPQADGFAFVMQNDPAGDTALGTSGNCIGVCDISNYAAIAFQSYTNNTAGLWLDGVKTTQFFDTGDQADVVDVTVTYSQVTTTLAFTATNTSTGATVSGSYSVDLTTLGPSVYIGFSGGSGASGSVEQVTKWRFKFTD